MRILFLTSAVPHANANSGFIVAYERIKQLIQRGHEVGLATFTNEDDRSKTEELEPLLHELKTVPLPKRGKLAKFLDFVFAPIPYGFTYVRSEQMRKTVGEMVQRSHYDVVVAEFSQMGQHLYHNPYLPAVRRVISCHSCYTAHAIRALRVHNWTPSALMALMDFPRLKRYEFDMYRAADHIVALTDEDRVDLSHHAPNLTTSTSPYGVDTSHYKPNLLARGTDSLIYTGYFKHESNQDAIAWFTKDIWPELRRRFPKLTFYAVGREAPKWMIELGKKDPSIVVTGEVPDVAQYLTTGKLYVCPMRFGRGLKGKVLQAMSSGIPVVSTSIGAEGISAQSGHSILLADTAHTMIESVTLLLQDRQMRRSLAKNARRLVSSDYSWKHCVDQFEEALEGVVNQATTFRHLTG